MRSLRTQTALRLVARLLLPLTAACVSAPAAWAQFSGSVAVSSEYIYRGQALSGGNPAVQVGLDFAHDSGIFAGIWSSTLDLPNPTGRRDVELDLYLGYQHAFDNPLSAAVSIVRYTYPGQTGDFDYDYTEALLTVIYDERYSVEFAYTSDQYGFDAVGRHVELRGDWPLENAWVISAGLGHSDLDDLDTSDYLYWDVGASARYSRLTVDLRWYDNETPAGRLGWLSAGSQLVATLSFAF